MDKKKYQKYPTYLQVVDSNRNTRNQFIKILSLTSYIIVGQDMARDSGIQKVTFEKSSREFSHPKTTKIEFYDEGDLNKLKKDYILSDEHSYNNALRLSAVACEIPMEVSFPINKHQIELLAKSFSKTFIKGDPDLNSLFEIEDHWKKVYESLRIKTDFGTAAHQANLSLVDFIIQNYK